jgi:FAD binding domain
MLVARCDRRRAGADPQDHALVGRRCACLVVLPRRRVPRRGRGTPPPADRGPGLTSAIHDAQNLCWKIAAVLADGASAALLDTYEAERRPVDERNCQRSLENALNHFAIATALGVAPENSAGQNMALLRRMWSGRPEDAELRSSALRAMRAQSMEFSELNVEYGYTHGSAAVVPDDIRVYEPSTRPGAPLPHSASRRDLRRDGRSATPRLVAMMAPSLPTCLGTITSNRPTSSRALR